MARRPRIFAEGAIYHVYCRTARGLRAFDDPNEADALVELLREIKERDGWTVYAWCVMPTHYHIALRTSSVGLSTTMHAVQGRFAQAYNRRHETVGAFWQGRFRAQMVATQAYIEQLVFYIHLNPVKAGLVGDVASYRWSGHRELVGSRSAMPVIDVDHSLQLFGRSVREARVSYLQRLEIASGSQWALADTTRLPWWVGDEERLLEATEAGAQVDELGRSTAPVKPHVELPEFTRVACAMLQVEPDLLTGRSRLGPLAFARMVMATVGVHSFALKSKDLAPHLGRHADSVSKLAVAGLWKRRREQRFRQACEELEATLSRQGGSIPKNEERNAVDPMPTEEEKRSGAQRSSSWEVWD